MQQFIESPASPCQLNFLRPYFTRRFSLQVCFAMLRLTTVPQSAFPRRRTRSYIGMRSSFPLTSPGVFTKYVFVSPTFREYPFTYLCQMYRTHTFRRVGPPKDVLRMYAVRDWFGQTLKPCTLTCLSAVFSRGFGQHSGVGFHPGQCDVALGRSTSSWTYQ